MTIAEYRRGSRRGRRRGVTLREFPFIPERGDLCRVLEAIRFESGVVLRADQNVLVDVFSGGENPYVGVKWRDAEGTHVAAVLIENLEVVL